MQHFVHFIISGNLHNETYLKLLDIDVDHFGMESLMNYKHLRP